MFDNWNKIYFERNYPLEINKVLAQNPPANAKTLLKFADSNSGLHFDENGEQRPDKYAAYCWIHNYDEKQYI